ncbi:hypothetical protein DAPPUDRAFT_268614 [Daphnia pulex]|uniref:CCHC-type domain-containing protein n=1 Tax=Daphnia pulex TaxID=6669 RepID=E9HY28_DAPPU|nr:hypothetical protein DAPPUDRAFT_268614 [Daphnia pulex]|eukprot:EFX63352.1 hypothetical protein DAPPUDRAFT_268614 [Daphnia pulex]
MTVKESSFPLNEHRTQTNPANKTIEQGQFDEKSNVGITCYNCGQSDHHKNYCPELKKWDRTRNLGCNFCGVKGHKFCHCPTKNASQKIANIWNTCILNAYNKTHKSRGGVVMTLSWHEANLYVPKWINERDGVYLAEL